jgi:hypothetical protein
MTHLAAQRALVRMMYDPAFVAAVKADPDRVLAHLPPSLRAQLQAIDPRAFALDPLRQRRTLGHLAEEWKATVTLVLAETRSYAHLAGFFSSSEFHEAVETRGPLPLAFAAWLAAELAAGRLGSPLTAEVLAVETASAHARRAPPPPSSPSPGLTRAPGVSTVRVSSAALEAIQAAERYLFEAALLPQVTLAADLPGPSLPERNGSPLTLIAVPLDGAVSLVTVEPALATVLDLAGPPGGPGRPRARLLAEAEARGLDARSAEDHLAELIDGELIVSG